MAKGKKQKREEPEEPNKEDFPVFIAEKLRQLNKPSKKEEKKELARVPKKLQELGRDEPLFWTLGPNYYFLWGEPNCEWYISTKASEMVAEQLFSDSPEWVGIPLGKKLEHQTENPVVRDFMKGYGSGPKFEAFKKKALHFLEMDWLIDKRIITDLWEPLLGKVYSRNKNADPALEIEKAREFANNIGFDDLTTIPDIFSGGDLYFGFDELFGKKPTEEQEARIAKAIVLVAYPHKRRGREQAKMLNLLKELSTGASTEQVCQWTEQLAKQNVLDDKLRATVTLAHLLRAPNGKLLLNPSKLVANSRSMELLGQEYFRPLANYINVQLGTQYYSEDELGALEKQRHQKGVKTGRQKPKKYQLSGAEKKQWFQNALTLAENMYYINENPNKEIIFKGGDAHRRITNQKEFREVREYLQSKGMKKRIYTKKSKGTAHHAKNSSQKEKRRAAKLLSEAMLSVIGLSAPHNKELNAWYRDYCGISHSTDPSEELVLADGPHSNKIYKALTELEAKTHDYFEQLSNNEAFSTSEVFYEMERMAGPKIKRQQHPAYYDDRFGRDYADEYTNKQQYYKSVEKPDKDLTKLDYAYAECNSLNWPMFEGLLENAERFKKELQSCKNKKQRQALVKDPKNVDTMIFLHFKQAHMSTISKNALEYANAPFLTGKDYPLRDNELRSQVIFDRLYAFLTDPHVGMRQTPFYAEKEIGEIKNKIARGLAGMDPPEEKPIYLSARFAKRDPKETPFGSTGMGECTGVHEPAAFVGRDWHGEGLFASQFDYNTDPGHEIIDIYEHKDENSGPSLRPIARAYVLLTETKGGLMPVIDSIELQQSFLHKNGRNHSVMKGVFSEVTKKIGEVFPKQKKVLVYPEPSNKPAMAGYMMSKKYKLKTHTVTKIGHTDRGYSNTFGELGFSNPYATPPIPLDPNAHIKKRKFYEVHLK